MKEKKSLSRSQSGFTLIELLVSMAIVGILLGLAATNFFVYVGNTRDTLARSDYRNIKVALHDLVNGNNAPTRISIRRAVGPLVLPEPLQMVALSSDVSANITYVKRYRNNRPPRTTTNIDVYHRDGTVMFRYRERNGVVTEQEVAL